VENLGDGDADGRGKEAGLAWTSPATQSRASAVCGVFDCLDFFTRARRAPYWYRDSCSVWCQWVAARDCLLHPERFTGTAGNRAGVRSWPWP
jgi:hypothetical protein